MTPKNTSPGTYKAYRILLTLAISTLATSLPGIMFASTVTNLFTATLTDSGSSEPLPVLAAATEPNEPGHTPPLTVNQPSAACPQMLGVINPSIALPTNSSIRQIEAFFNGTPLPLIDDKGKIVEEAHSYGSVMGFWRPLFSVAAIPAGPGTLEVKGYDGSHTQIAAVQIPNLTVASSPSPVTSAALASTSHPRIYLTPERLAAAKNRSANDPSVVRFWGQDGVGAFLEALKVSPDPEAAGFVHYIWDPEDYIPALSLCYQLKKDNDPATAATCAAAAKRMTLKMSADYDSGARSFARDSGYDIRFGLRDLMISYDWLYDLYSPAERTQIVKVATKWVDWYTNTPGYQSTNPANNYYAGYLQGLTLTAVATAGENTASDRLLTLLRSKLATEVPILNQRACGDWPEGWNYGPYTLIEYSLVNQTLKDVGENWGASFNFLEPLPRTLTYQTSPDMSGTISFGGYSGNLPHKTSPALLAILSGTATDGAAAARLYNAMYENKDNDWSEARGNTMYEIIFGNFTTASNASNWPLSNLSPDTGRFFSKSSLSDPNAYQVSVENTNAHFDHFGYSNGDVRLYHGTTCLLCPSAYRGNSFDGEAFTSAFSTYLVNGKAQTQNRNNQILFTLENSTWSAIGTRFESSWANGRYDENLVDTQNPLNYLVREVVHIRPGTVIVRDLHQRRHSTDTLTANWHLGSSSAVQTIDAHHYKIDTLNVSTFYPPGVNTVFTSDKDAGGNRIGTLMQQNLPASTAALEMITVFSETLTGVSYTNNELRLSDNTCALFANGTVQVHVCGDNNLVPPQPVPPLKPITTPTPAPVPTPNPAKSLPTVKLNINLLPDPYFEKSTSGFYAQDATDSVKRITTKRLYGKGSLQIQINGNSNHIWWVQYTSTTLPYGGTLQFTTSIRNDLTSTTTLRVCASAYYNDGGIVKQCSNASKIKNRTIWVTASLKIDPKRTVHSVGVLLYNDGPGPVRYTLDNASLKLRASKAVKK